MRFAKLFGGLILVFSTLSVVASGRVITDPKDPLAKTLSEQYLRYKSAGMRGDVSAYFAIRTHDVATGMAKETSASLMRYAKYDFDLAQYKLVRVDARPKVARAIWERKEGETMTYQAIMYSLENGEWKVGDILESVNTGDMSKVPGPTGLEQLVQHRRTQLPSN
jgi:hypothetical protein